MGAMTDVCPTCHQRERMRRSSVKRGKVKAVHLFTNYWLPVDRRATVHRQAVRGLVVASRPAQQGLRVRGAHRTEARCVDPWHDRPKPLPPLPPEAERVYLLAERRIASATAPRRRKAKARKHRARQSRGRR